MRALSIRQPWAELILRGIKTVEFRSRPTRIVGERFYIYASRGKVELADVTALAGGGGDGGGGVWSAAGGGNGHGRGHEAGDGRKAGNVTGRGAGNAKRTARTGHQEGSAAGRGDGLALKAWSRELTVPGRVDERTAMMLRLAAELIVGGRGVGGGLPTGVIVGRAMIERVTPFDAGDGLGHAGMWRWHLAEVERLERPRRPRGQPQPVWFHPSI